MQSMDLFWHALYDYYKWKQKWPFHLVNQEWEKFEQDLSWYFRSEKEINKDLIDRILFENVSWKKLLDIWCATAYYFPILERKVQNIRWIDISEKAIQVAREFWNINVEVGDILNWYIIEKYDIITLVWNNLSIWWDVEWSEKYFKILKNTLAPNWKILAVFMRLEEKDYFLWKFVCEYNWEKSLPFNWIRMSLNFLRSLLHNTWLSVKVLAEDDYGYCLEIKHSD
jgi:SAM-dependent methyltransferase